jgi:hypothetical protein
MCVGLLVEAILSSSKQQQQNSAKWLELHTQIKQVGCLS